MFGVFLSEVFLVFGVFLSEVFLVFGVFKVDKFLVDGNFNQTCFFGFKFKVEKMNIFSEM